MKKYLLPACCLLFAACHNTTNSDNPNGTDAADTVTTSSNGVAAPQMININIVGIYPHDTSSFTEGFELHDGKLYESAGDYENSSLRYADVKTGVVEKKHMMGSDDIFGEGITIFKDKIYQLTWTNHIVYVYDINNIDKPIKTLSWPYEGWGQTHDDSELIVSTGSSNLYFVDPETYKVKRILPVVDDNGPVLNVNELEYVDGYVYSNVWQTNTILKIDPKNGHVVGKINIPDDFLSVYAPGLYVDGRTDVLNGLAWDSTQKLMYITGKRWPKVFAVKLQ